MIPIDNRNQNQKPALWLFCENFPFGYDEITFIPPELEALRKRFSVTIITTNLTGSKSIQLPSDVRVIRNDTSKGKIAGRVQALFSPVFWREVKAIIGGGNNIPQKVSWALSWFSLGIASINSLKSLPKPDVIYCFWRRPYLFGALMNKKKLGNPPVICRAHGKDLFLERAPLGYFPFAGETDRMMDGIYLVSRAGYDYYMKHFSSSDPPKANIAYLGCPGAGGGDVQDGLRYDLRIVPCDTPRHDEFKIFSCSHLVPLKRVDKIIYALSLAANNMPGRRIAWVHAGGGSEEDALRKQAENLPPNVRWEILGALPNEAVRRKLAEGFHCFVTASETEGGVPVSIAEAFSCGIPAIGTNAGGIPEIVTPGTGVLLPNDVAPGEIAAAIIKMADMPDEEYNALRRNAYNLWRDKFDALKNADAFAETLAGLARAGSSHTQNNREVKKILIISQLYAPNPGIGAVRWTKLAKYLARAGLEVEVLTDAMTHPESESYRRDVAEISAIHRVGQGAIGGEAPAVVEPSALKAKIKALPPVLFALRALNVYKDYEKGRSFAQTAAEYIEKNISIPSYDAVIVTFGPVGNVMLAKWIKQKWPGTRLLADFRDPMNHSFQPPLLRRKYAAIQRDFCDMADRLTTVTESFAGHIFGDRYPDKWRLVSNGYDPEDFAGDAGKGDKFSFVYTGQMYEGERDLSPVFRAVRRLIDESRLSENDVEFHYAGQDGSAVFVQAGRYGLDNRVINHGRVPREEAIALQRQSGFLVLCSWNYAGQPSPLTGKLYEYMAAGRPIVATVLGNCVGGELRRIIERGGLGITHEQADSDADRALYEYLREQAGRFKQGQDIIYNPDNDFVKSFAHTSLAKEILDILTKDGLV